MKKYKGKRIPVIVIILSLLILIYILLNTKKSINLIKKEVKLVESQIIKTENEDLTDEYEYIKNNINEVFYEEEESIESINYFIETKDIQDVNSGDEDLVNKFKENYNKMKLIIEYSKKYLNDGYNILLETNMDYYLEDEKTEFESLKNKYLEGFSQNKYKSSKGYLEEIQSFIEKTNKLANKRRLDEIYEKNYNQSSYLREPKIVNGILLVNKEFGLSESYAPGEDYETRQAFEKMKGEALNDGVYIEAFSTYRSYYTQYDLYYDYAYNYGKEKADTFSARAGFSEHQTGLALDIGGLDKNLWAKEEFKYTDEAIWLKENAYKYGFILRYPEGKEWKTGYMYESWHFRYVGIEHSVNFVNNDLTLEEYLGY